MSKFNQVCFTSKKGNKKIEGLAGSSGVGNQAGMPSLNMQKMIPAFSLPKLYIFYIKFVQKSVSIISYILDAITCGFGGT